MIQPPLRRFLDQIPDTVAIFRDVVNDYLVTHRIEQEWNHETGRAVFSSRKRMYLIPKAKP